MCEIQFIKTERGKLNEEDTKEFFRLMRKGSKGNPDAYGVFNTSISLKRGIGFHQLPKKERKKLIFEFKNKHEFLVGHNRLATQGCRRINKNNHPFHTNELCVVHNGIVSNDYDLKAEHELTYKEQTDSAIIIHLMQKYLDEKVEIVEAIEKAANQLIGSLSVFIFHKPTKKLYYFKNSGTSFYIGFGVVGTKKVMLGSTNYTSLNDAYPNNDDKLISIKEPANNVLYEVRQDDFYGLRKLETQTWATTIVYNGWNEGRGGYYANNRQFDDDYYPYYNNNKYATVEPVQELETYKRYSKEDKASALEEIMMYEIESLCNEPEKVESVMDEFGLVHVRLGSNDSWIVEDLDSLDLNFAWRRGHSGMAFYIQDVMSERGFDYFG